MIKQIALAVLFMFSFKAECQNFGALPYLDNGIFPYYIERILTDSIHDQLIVSSKFMKNANGKVVRGICSWNSFNWDSLSSGINTHDQLNTNPNGMVLGCIPYNNKLLVGGIFRSIGRVKASYIALWDGSTWDSLPVRPFQFLNYNVAVNGFLKHNGTIYIHGAFDTIQGQPANGLATFDGSSFHPVALPFDNQASIMDMKVFQNEIYIAGNFNVAGNPNICDIYKFNGNTWTDVGGSIKGAFSGVNSMVVYNNQLYVGGFFDKAAGNAGNILMRWDGTAWYDAGWGSALDNGAIYKLLVHHNKLFAFGSSEFASDMYAPRAAVLDGTKWCSYNDTIENGVYSATVYHDTIFFAGGFKKINSDTSKKYISKIVDENFVNHCNPLSISESRLTEDVISIYPNPANENITIDFNSFNTSNTNLELVNSIGQIIKTFDNLTQQQIIDLSKLSSGIYFIKIKNYLEQRAFKIIKEE